MVNKVSNIEKLCGHSLFIILGCCCFVSCEAQKVPAMYVFGDSLVDVGTNNHLKLSLAKANFPHNGIDYPGQKPTGRFNNGKNTADFLAEKVGLATAPPYLSLVMLIDKIRRNVSFPITGVSFASGGAGIFNTTNQLFRQSISLQKQIEQFERVNAHLVQSLGSIGAQNHLSKSLFTIVIGNNDLLVYFNTALDLSKKSTPQQYIDSIVWALKAYLKISVNLIGAFEVEVEVVDMGVAELLADTEKIYSLGARKFIIAGVGAIGCTPSLRNQNKATNDDCDQESNHWSVQYNEGLKSMLHDMKALELKAMEYSYVDIFNVFTSFLESPTNYGFTEAKSACCGRGNLKAELPCVPISEYCSNRTNHIFWDLYHPTQAASSIFVDTIYSGSPLYALPMNVEQLLTI